MAELTGVSRPLTERFGDPEEGLIYRRLVMVDRHGERHPLIEGNDSLGVAVSDYWDVGLSPDSGFLAFLVITVGSNATSNAIRFASAATCAEIRFARVPDGRDIGAAFVGWKADAPHTVTLQRGRIAMPVEEKLR